MASLTPNKVAVLVGPTAVGKTAVALELARRLGAQIVNADSLQVYRELDIGTAKPSPAERLLVPHHLVDVAAPPEPYDAARYSREGRAVLAALHARGIPPLVVGGSGLYLKALLYGLFEAGSPRGEIRMRLKRELTDLGPLLLHQRLAALDPITAGRLHPHDRYRILRALEVMEASGRPLSELFQAHRFSNCPYRILKLGLRIPREELQSRIALRLTAMLAGGFLQEVEELLGRYPPDLKPLQSLGYRHLGQYLRGERSWEEAIASLEVDTRRYAKRQRTWFRADPEINWFHPEQVEEMGAALAGFFAV
ncbi:MAG: tRNA (adenosine(37)-N6)-dimethylallyltransferase MiaA [Desulfobaccales bacterium]|jgi:tRNA dimethylallyltransferase